MFPRRCVSNSSADILSAVSFDQSGEYFATGDRGGRVVIFKKGDAGKPKVRTCITVLHSYVGPLLLTTMYVSTR